MNEEELKAKADELQEREGELQKKEEEIKQREEELNQREADKGNIAQTIKEEFDKQLEKQKRDYEARIASRDEIIKQLSAGENKAPAQPTFIEILNEKREKQKKW